MKNIRKVGLIFLSLLLMNGCSNRGTMGRNELKGDQLSIGIIQYQENQQALDMKKGFVDSLRNSGLLDNPVTIDNKVLKDNGTIESLIVERFLDQGVDLIYAIMPKENSIIFDATKLSNLPVVYVSEKFLTLDHSNVTGVVYELALAKQFQLIKSLLPSVQTIGIFQETDAQMDKVAFENGFILQNINEELEEEEIKAECLFIGQQVENLDEALTKAKELKLPIFGMDQANLEHYVAIEVVNDYEVGKQAGELAYELLVNGMSFDELPVEESKGSEILVNKKESEKFDIKIPLEIAKRIKIDQ